MDTYELFDSLRDMSDEGPNAGTKVSVVPVTGFTVTGTVESVTEALVRLRVGKAEVVMIPLDKIAAYSFSV